VFVLHAFGASERELKGGDSELFSHVWGWAEGTDGRTDCRRDPCVLNGQHKSPSLLPTPSRNDHHSPGRVCALASQLCSSALGRRPRKTKASSILALFHHRPSATEYDAKARWPPGGLADWLAGGLHGESSRSCRQHLISLSHGRVSDGMLGLQG
jgi:hypothetical protein